MKNNLLFLTLILICVLAACKKSSNSTPPTPPPIKNGLVYIYKNDSSDGVSFKNLLQVNGCSVILVDKSAAAAFDYSAYNMVIIGNNSDSLSSHDNWNVAAATTIKNSGKPCLLLGEGGLFFANAIGDTVNWETSAGNSLTSFVALDPTNVLYKQPKKITIGADSLVTIYSSASQVTSFYLKTPPLANIVLVGREYGVAGNNYYSITIDNIKYGVFGFHDNADKMTATGKDLFVNLVYYTGNLTL